eukprot:5035180-Pleurochrysis_carterae.AAC.2
MHSFAHASSRRAAAASLHGTRLHLWSQSFVFNRRAGDNAADGGVAGSRLLEGWQGALLPMAHGARVLVCKRAAQQVRTAHAR